MPQNTGVGRNVVLDGLDFASLQRVWEQAFGAAPPRSLSRVFLCRVLAYERQCRTHGGLSAALLHGPEQIADLPVPVAESPGAVRIGHPERSHLVEYLAPNSVFNSLPRQRSSPHLRPDDRLVTIDRVLHHASLGVA